MIPLVVLLGAPGSGKGTQAASISSLFGYEIVSTGDLIRAEISSNSDDGIKMAEYLNNGQLVPDAFISKLLNNVLHKNSLGNGLILDGIPRTVYQAKLLDSILSTLSSLKVHIFFFQIPYDLLTQRILGRLICSKCKELFHSEFSPPKKSGCCDHCGSKLLVRSDDTLETLNERYRVFNKNMVPIISFYGEKVKVIDATKNYGGC